MKVPDHKTPFASRRLEAVFSSCFRICENTVLMGGADEPFYAPAERPDELHRLYYREDYFASALHEIAHWCIAGPERRKLPDFGYWYAPEGRSEQQQQAFLAVEARPQALEWYLSHACGFAFQPSLDDFSSRDAAQQRNAFMDKVYEESRALHARGLPSRAATFADALAVECNTDFRSTCLPMLWQPEPVSLSMAKTARVSVR